MRKISYGDVSVERSRASSRLMTAQTISDWDDEDVVDDEMSELMIFIHSTTST